MRIVGLVGVLATSGRKEFALPNPDSVGCGCGTPAESELPELSQEGGFRGHVYSKIQIYFKKNL